MSSKIERLRVEAERWDRMTLWQTFRTWPWYAQVVWWIWVIGHASLSIWAAYELYQLGI